MVTSKRIYKIKHTTDGSVEKYKMRSIGRGFSQIKGVVNDETLDPLNLIHSHPYYHP
jgi:hypothetical protein